MSLYIKRKQINYDLLDQRSSPSSSQCSLASAPQNHLHEVITKKSIEKIDLDKHLNEKAELEKQLKQATQNEKSWRHKFKLIENEQHEYEKSIQSQYEKEKEALELELKILRQTHTEKVQSMSTSMLQLQKQVARLRRQLATNGITEENDDDDDDDSQEWLFSSLKEDAEFIKTAHQQAMHEYSHPTSHPLWMSIQKNALDLRHELATLQASALSQHVENPPSQKCPPNEEATFKVDDKTLSSGLKKVIFGKTHKSVKRKSAIFIS